MEQSGRPGRAWIVLLAGAVLLVLLFVLTLFTSGSTPLVRSRSGESAEWGMRCLIALMQLFTGLWCFAVASSLGSFFNVLVYRMPRGESVVSKPSYCPQCGSNIRFRDNIPVLGWLLLGGECRDCGLPIPKRYPLVELLAGIMFTSIVYVELLSGGANLPGVRPFSSGGISWTLVDVHPEMLWICAYHMTLLGVLLTASLIKYDGHVIPFRLWGFGVLVGIVMPHLNHQIYPVPWVSLYPAIDVALPLIGPGYDLLVGIGIGGMLGLLITSLIPARAIDWQSMSSRPEISSMTALVGLYLGWQAALACALLALMLKGAETLTSFVSGDTLRLPLIGYLVLGTYCQICLWSYSSQWEWWPGPRSSWLMVVIVFAMCATIVFFIGQLRPRPRDEAPDAPWEGDAD